MVRWSDDGTCVNPIGRTIRRMYDHASRVLARELGGNSCSRIFSMCIIPRGGIGTAACIHHVHGSLFKVKSDLKNSLLIRSIYTSLEMTCNGSTCVARSYETCITTLSWSYNTRIQRCESSRDLRNCESTQRCATLCECSWNPMQQFESPSVASEFWTCSKFRGGLMRPFSRIKEMRCIVQRTRC